MRQITEAVYADGVLTPTAELRLEERQRVRITVEAIEQGPVDREGALARFRVGVASSRFFSTGPLPAREELHRRS